MSRIDQARCQLVVRLKPSQE